MTLEWSQTDQAWLARMWPTAQGLPNILSMEHFLWTLCDEYDPTKYSLLLVSYETRCFGALRIKGIQALEEVAGKLLSASAAPDSDDEEEAKALKRRTDLLKKVMAAGKPAQEKPIRKAKAKARNASKRARKRKNVNRLPGDESESGQDGACAEEANANEEEPGVAGEMAKAIEGSWSDALQAELPQFHEPASSSSSSRPARTGTASTASSSTQPPRPPGPWQDDNGHCFLTQEGTAPPLYLGTGLRYLKCNEN